MADVPSEAGIEAIRAEPEIAPLNVACLLGELSQEQVDGQAWRVPLLFERLGPFAIQLKITISEDPAALAAAHSSQMVIMYSWGNGARSRIPGWVRRRTRRDEAEVRRDPERRSGNGD